jgi:hypothetical protein
MVKKRRFWEWPGCGLLTGLALVVGLSGCAAILGSKQKDFSLTSQPAGAAVYLDGNRLGTTPLKVKLSNQAEHTFVFRRQGYEETSCTLSKGTGGGWVVLDIITGLVPVIIDAATGSWSQTKGDSCNGNLEPAGQGQAVDRVPADSAITWEREVPGTAQR